MARRQSKSAAELSPQRRHHRRGADAEGQLVRSRGAGSGATGPLLRGGRILGEIEEYFIEGLVSGDTFVFGGEVVRYEALVEDQVYVSRANDRDAKVPSYMGGKFPLSTYLAERVRKLLDDRRQWNALPDQVRDWLSLQRAFSRVPAVRELLIETFPRGENIISSAIPSKDASRTRRSACC